MKKITINLEDYRVEYKGVRSKVFTGRDRGKQVRESSNIDKYENEYDIIVIQIPDDIYSINPSFLEEFLYNVVKKLGKEAFLKKFEVESNGSYDIRQDLIEAIDRILNDNPAI